ncbi:MAG TPA: hypothetical protein VG476_07570 [Acidimicrobiales bacterium]|nr:hypothetical protein [Acidimicrobiales bacterium]
MKPGVTLPPGWIACEVTRKRRYRTRVECLEAIGRTRRSVRRHEDVPELYPYKCRFCKDWHMTRQAP